MNKTVLVTDAKGGDVTTSTRQLEGWKAGLTREVSGVKDGPTTAEGILKLKDETPSVDMLWQVDWWLTRLGT